VKLSNAAGRGLEWRHSELQAGIAQDRGIARDRGSRNARLEGRRLARTMGSWVHWRFPVHALFPFAKPSQLHAESPVLRRVFGAVLDRRQQRGANASDPQVRASHIEPRERGTPAVTLRSARQGRTGKTSAARRQRERRHSVPGHCGEAVQVTNAHAANAHRRLGLFNFSRHGRAVASWSMIISSFHRPDETR
jgi:hypothetical protein